MASRFRDRWGDLFDRKERELVENDCATALQISGLADLQASLHLMATDYQHTTFPDILTRMQPGLNYLEAFTAAITSATQYDPRACLAWGALQAFVVSACQSKLVVDDMLALVMDLNESLPGFTTDLEAFPNCAPLHVHLQAIYDSYVDYCLSSVQYMRRGSTAHFLTYFFGFNPASALRTTKAEIEKHIRLFERAANSARQQKALQMEVQKTLKDAPLSEVPSNVEVSAEEEIQYPVSNITMFRNFTFTGRTAELKEIRSALVPKSGVDTPTQSEDSETTTIAPHLSRQLLNKRGKMPACCVLQGLGGIGKTQTALEYSFHYERAYDAMFWVRSDLESTLAASFAAISHDLGLMKDVDAHEGQNQGLALEHARKWFRTTTRRWLLIFDNVEDQDDLNGYLPTKIEGEGAVIITTQKLDFFPITDQFTTINLRNLERTDGAGLMFQYLRRDPINEEEREYACKISDLLGGLPLAIATIGGYIEQTDDTVSGYYESLKTSSSAWEASAIGPAKQYEKTLKTVFATALLELPAEARCMINILAYLSPDNIPEELFTKRISKSSLLCLSSKARYIETIRQLRRRQLVRRDTTGSVPYLSIHRTVQWAVLHDLSRDNDLRHEAYKQAFDLVRSAMPEPSSIDNPEPELWSQFERYVPQVLHLRAHCLWPEPPMVLSIEFAQVLCNIATYMWHAGLLIEGTDAMRTAEEILDKHSVDSKNPLRGNIEEKLGIIASHCGVSRRDEAMSRRARAIEARNASHSEIPPNLVSRADEIRLWNVQSDLAFGLLQGEDFAKAGEVITKCHNQYQAWGPPSQIPFEYLKYNHIISYDHMASGRPVEAIKACKEGAALGEICCGLMHTMTQHVRASLSHLLFFTGDVEESLKEGLSVLRARQKIVGEYNHYTIESHAWVGALYAVQDRNQEAEEHFRECLDPSKRTIWDKEGYARAQFLYGHLLRNTGRSAEGDEYLALARETRDHFLELYPQWLQEDEENELVVFDQMVCLWAGRFTGKLTRPNVQLRLPHQRDDSPQAVEGQAVETRGEDDLSETLDMLTVSVSGPVDTTGSSEEADDTVRSPTRATTF